jgi:dTDP-4-dehydrorhamnose reductase
MKKILITGKNGQVGWELQRALCTIGDVSALDSREMNLANPDSIVQAIRHAKPDIIINAAAYTAVDLAEKERDLAMAVNGTAPGIIAEEAKKIGALLIHYSTDYVFNGRSEQPYSEEDSTDPINIYGHSKLMGERAIQDVGGDYLILRTSWVYASRGKNFLLTMLRLGKEKDQLRVVNDQHGAPTWSRLIAQASTQMLLRYQGQRGIYHLTCSGKTDWHAFAKEIFELNQRLTPGNRTPELIAIPTSGYPTPAKRPEFSVLSNRKVRETFSVEMPSWGSALALCMTHN